MTTTHRSRRKQSATEKRAHWRSKLSLLTLIAMLLTVISPSSNGGSATWKANPASGHWNTAANWTPATVPNGSADTASFATSSQTAISLSANTEVDAISFDSGADSFQITVT